MRRMGMVLLLGAVVALASPIVAGASVGARVFRTGGQGLNQRGGPSTSQPVVQRIPDGATVSLECYLEGQSIGGDPLWHQAVYNGRRGFVSDYYVDIHWRTRSDLAAQGVPPCGTPPAPVQGSAPPLQGSSPCLQGGCATAAPSTTAADRAVEWAEARVGQTSYEYLCLAFVHDAWSAGAGRDIGRAPAAYDYWTAHPAAQHRGDRNPPRGALVFFSWTGTADGQYRNWGHVALSRGDGTLVTSRERGTRAIHTMHIGDWPASSYLGWIAP